MAYEEDIKLFESASVEVSNVIKWKPPAGTSYIFEFGDLKKASDWRSDGWHFRQNGKKDYDCDSNGSGSKWYFHLRIRNGDETDAFTTEFKKEALTNSNYPNKVLLKYIGDEKVAVPVVHGGNKKPGKTDRPMVRKAQSVVEEMKERCRENPNELYDELINRHTVLDQQKLNCPRDRKQITNCQEAGRRAQEISRDFIHHIVELYYETQFVRDFLLLPSFVISCILKGKIFTFLKLIVLVDYLRYKFMKFAIALRHVIGYIDFHNVLRFN